MQIYWGQAMILKVNLKNMAFGWRPFKLPPFFTTYSEWHWNNCMYIYYGYDWLCFAVIKNTCVPVFSLLRQQLYMWNDKSSTHCILYWSRFSLVFIAWWIRQASTRVFIYRWLKQCLADHYFPLNKTAWKGSAKEWFVQNFLALQDCHREHSFSLL